MDVRGAEEIVAPETDASRINPATHALLWMLVRAIDRIVASSTQFSTTVCREPRNRGSRRVI
jgi:hypothetical protein